MNADDQEWCHDCDEPVRTWAEFTRHANAGHAISMGRCLDGCQFTHAGAP